MVKRLGDGLSPQIYYNWKVQNKLLNVIQYLSKKRKKRMNSNVEIEMELCTVLGIQRVVSFESCFAKPFSLSTHDMIFKYFTYTC